MAKKNELNINTILIIVALIIFAVVVIPKLNLMGGFQFGSIVDPMSLFDNAPDSECTFEVDYPLVCLGNNVTGTLMQNLQYVILDIITIMRVGNLQE